MERYTNWMAEKGKEAGATWSIVPWQAEDMLSIFNSQYQVCFARRYRLTRPEMAKSPNACDCGHRRGMPGYDEMGDHDEGTCKKNAHARKEAHDSWGNTWMAFLNACGMRGVKMEVLDWAPRGRNDWANVPDIVCQDPMGIKSYIIDCRIAWNHTTGGGKGYKKTGDLAIEGERKKREKWDLACSEHRDFTTGNTDFVPLSAEVTGGWGPAAKSFFNEGVKWAGQGRDVDLYTWSSASFEGFWKQALAACMARERGKVGLKARLRTTDVSNATTTKRFLTETAQDEVGR